MSNVTLKVEGLDELTTDLQKIISEYPKETAKELNKVGREFRKDYLQKVRSTAKRTSGRPKSLEKAKNVKVRGNKLREKGEAVDIYATSPHFHLFERGHEIVTAGGPTGRSVEGRFCMKETVDEYEKKMPELAGRVLDEVLKKGGF